MTPRTIILSLVSAVALLALAGCETTGNPNADTIFWSRNKAEQRLADQRGRLSESNQRADDLRDQQGNLRATQHLLDTETAQLNGDLANLRVQTQALNDAINRKDASISPEALLSLKTRLNALTDEIQAVLKADVRNQTESERRIAGLTEQVNRTRALVMDLVHVRIDEPKPMTPTTKPPVASRVP